VFHSTVGGFTNMAPLVTRVAVVDKTRRFFAYWRGFQTFATINQVASCRYLLRDCVARLSCFFVPQGQNDLIVADNVISNSAELFSKNALSHLVASLASATAAYSVDVGNNVIGLDLVGDGFVPNQKGTQRYLEIVVMKVLTNITAREIGPSLALLDWFVDTRQAHIYDFAVFNVIGGVYGELPVDFMNPMDSNNSFLAYAKQEVNQFGYRVFHACCYHLKAPTLAEFKDRFTIAREGWASIKITIKPLEKRKDYGAFVQGLQIILQLFSHNANMFMWGGFPLAAPIGLLSDRIINNIAVPGRRTPGQFAKGNFAMSIGPYMTLANQSTIFTLLDVVTVANQYGLGEITTPFATVSNAKEILGYISSSLMGK